MEGKNELCNKLFFTDGSFRFADQNGCRTGHSDLFSLHRQKYLGIYPAGTSRQRTPFHQVHRLVFLHIIHLWRTVLRLFYPAPAGKFRLEFCHTEHKSRFWRFRHHFNRTLAVGSFRADVSVSADYPLANSFRYRFLPLRNRQTSASFVNFFSGSENAPNF